MKTVKAVNNRLVEKIGTHFLGFEVTLHYNANRLMHTHNVHEFYCCVSGRGLQHTSGADYSMKKGDLFFFPAEDPHIGNGIDSGKTKGLVLNLSERLFERNWVGDSDFLKVLDVLSKRAFAGKHRVELSAEGGAKVQQLLADIAREQAEQRGGFEGIIKTHIQQILMTIMRDRKMADCFSGQSNVPVHRYRFNRVVRHVETQYMFPIKVEAMAKMAGLSRSHFHRLFKEEMGFTLLEYTNRIRVRAAEQMLAEQDRAILDVALACGFQSLSHFYYVFKKLTGRSPGTVGGGR